MLTYTYVLAKTLKHLQRFGDASDVGDLNSSGTQELRIGGVWLN